MLRLVNIDFHILIVYLMILKPSKIIFFFYPFFDWVLNISTWILILNLLFLFLNRSINRSVPFTKLALWELVYLFIIVCSTMLREILKGFLFLVVCGTTLRKVLGCFIKVSSWFLDLYLRIVFSIVCKWFAIWPWSFTRRSKLTCFAK